MSEGTVAIPAPRSAAPTAVAPAPPPALPCASIAGRHVLVVGINYAPEPTGIGPYTTGMAEHLARNAASVSVITGLPSYPHWQVDPAYRGRRRYRESARGVDLVRLWHSVPRRQDAVRRGVYEATFAAHAAALRPTRTPDLVIGVTPALGGAVAAARLAARHQAPLVLIVQDLLGAAAAQSGMAGGGRVAAAVARAEAWALRRADQVITVADAFRGPITTYGVDPGRVHTVRNWSRLRSPRRHRAAERARRGWSGRTVVLHTGNMGLKQGLQTVVEAARHTQDRPDLLWALMGEGSQRASLQQAAQGLANLQFLPLCSGEDYPEILAAADLLLMCERPGVQDMSLPSKLTSYFASGVPVVSSVPEHGSTAGELARAGAPRPTPAGDPAALAAHVLALRADTARRAEHAGAARAYAQHHLSHAAAMSRLDHVLAAALR